MLARMKAKELTNEQTDISSLLTNLITHGASGSSWHTTRTFNLLSTSFFSCFLKHPKDTIDSALIQTQGHSDDSLCFTELLHS